jgi:hypothetical protein
MSDEPKRHPLSRATLRPDSLTPRALAIVMLGIATMVEITPASLGFRPAAAEGCGECRRARPGRR